MFDADVGTIVGMELSFAQTPRRRVNLMDLNESFRFVAPSIRDAAVRTAAQLRSLDIRHALAGGLAVGAYGYVRATTHVDFLVGEEAFVHQGPFVTFKPGVPIEVSGIRIDYLSPVGLGAHLDDVLNRTIMSDDLAVVPIDVLIYMKLVAKRRKDLVDIVELLKAGADFSKQRIYLGQYAADLLPLFEELVNESLDDR